MTTQAQFITFARSRLDEPTARQWSDQDLRAWINEGARHIARNTLALEDRATIVGGVGTSEYLLPSSAIQITRVEFTPSGANTQTYKVEYSDMKNLDNFGWSQRANTTYSPFVYTVVGSGATLKLIVFPSQGAAGNFTVWYYRLPVALSETDATQQAVAVEIPQGYDDILTDFVEYRALRKDRDPRWQEAKSIFDENLGLMYDATRRWVDEAGAIMPQSGGLPSWLTERG